MTSNTSKHKYVLGSDVRVDGKQYKACQLGKNVARVTSAGEVLTGNDELYERVAALLTYSVPLERFVVRGSVPGATVRMIA